MPKCMSKMRQVFACSKPEYGTFILEPPRRSWLAAVAEAADPAKWAAAQARLRKEVA